MHKKQTVSSEKGVTMLIKEKARLVLVGVLTFCLVFTSTPAVALSLLAANPTNAYAENLTTSSDGKRVIKKHPRQKNQKALLRKTPHYLLKKSLKLPLKAPLDRSTTQPPKMRLSTRALKTTQATLQETPPFQIAPKQQPIANP